MNQSRWERFLPVTGILFVILAFIGMSMASGDQPGVDDSAENILQYFDNNNAKIVLGITITWVALFFALFFVGYLTSILRRTQGPGAWEPIVVLGGGVAMIAAFLVVTLFPYAAANRFYWDEQLDPQTAKTLFTLSWDGFVIVWFPMAAFIGATAISALRTALLPKWFAWLGIVLMIGLLFPMVAWFVFMLALAWVIILCIFLMTSRAGYPSPGSGGEGSDVALLA